MNWLLQIKEAYANLSSAKLRSFLAILGILVGTGSVVAMVSSGHLATEHALEQFAQLGTDLLAVSIFSDSSDNASKREIEFTLDDARMLQEKIPEIKEIAPYVSVYQDIIFSGNRFDGSIIGSTVDLQSVINIRTQKGRFISAFDQFTPFCIIGDGLAEQMKKSGISNPINTQIQSMVASRKP